MLKSNLLVLKYLLIFTLLSLHFVCTLGCFASSAPSATQQPQQTTMAPKVQLTTTTLAVTIAPTTTGKTSTTSYNIADLTQQLNSSLSNYLNLRFVTVLQSKAASSTRPTSEMGRLLNDIVNFVLSFASNSSSQPQSVAQSLTCCLSIHCFKYNL